MEPRSKKPRFGEVSEDAELQALDARTPMSTKTATTFWLGVFESFCVEKGRLQEPRQVEALKKLLAKLHPGVERLFQRGLKGNQPESKPTWFMKASLGHTVLGDMLPRISEAALLSRRYTNHCLRATSVCILKDSGFDDRAVCRLTGHKNPQSLESYCRSSENEKQALARALDGKMCRSRDVEDSSSSSKAAEMTTSCSRQDGFAFKNSFIHNLTINIKSEGDAS